MQQEQEYCAERENTEDTGSCCYRLVDALLLPVVHVIPAPSSNTLLARLQRFLVGNVAVADIACLIEGPRRLVPQQQYMVHVRLLGRDVPANEHGGLSSLTAGDEVRIVIYSALDELHMRLMREIVVTMPAQGSLLEATVPLIAIDSAERWHRERIQVQFFDSLDQPLYERPFAFDLMVSPRVRPGREGYTSITIPL